MERVTDTVGGRLARDKMGENCKYESINLYGMELIKVK
jgi:hypothetical protein